jgi:peptidyl-prolyl cis-trans isomerase B (cyclophilin B)
LTKAKTPTRPAPQVEQEEELILPETWRRRPWIPITILVAVLAVVLGAGLAMDKALQPVVPSQLADCKTSTRLGPHEFVGLQPICIKPDKNYTATLYTTQGNIIIKLHPEYAPVTVNNFVVLAVNGYYNGLTFWDAPDWEIQGGDPLGNGRGGPGYTLPEEKTNGLKWDVGSVGMARIPGGPVNGSQFFITKLAWPGKGPTAVYNYFGEVTGGLTDHVVAVTPGDRINTITIAVS